MPPAAIFATISNVTQPIYGTNSSKNPSLERPPRRKVRTTVAVDSGPLRTTPQIGPPVEIPGAPPPGCTGPIVLMLLQNVLPFNRPAPVSRPQPLGTMTNIRAEGKKIMQLAPHGCYAGTALAQHRYGTGAALVLHWCCTGTALVRELYCTGTPLVLRWCCTGTALVLY